MPAAQLEPLLTVDDVAKVLRLSLRTIRRLIAEGKLPVVRIGRAIRIRPQAVEAFLEGLERAVGNKNERK